MLLQGFFSLFFLAFSTGFAFYFRRKQNENTENGKWVGGAISWPKCFWLGYAIGSWFFIPFIFVLDPETPAPLKAVLVGHLVSWWVRGPLELVMIYRWFNWTPIYGISHDAFHSLFLFAGTAFATSQIGFEALLTKQAFWPLLYLMSLNFAMSSEMVFAALFIMARGETTSASKIYFASDEGIYRLINRLTASVCFLLYGHWIIQTLGLLLS
jgi:hypothetical protein